MNDAIIYLDHAAATPLDDQALLAMQPYFSEKFFNPSSPYAPALLVRRDYQEAKQRLAQQIGARADEIVMTAGATESINLAFSAGNQKCLVPAIEHASVLEAARRYSEPIIVQPEKYGKISPESIKAHLTPEVTLVSVALANHELGYIQPLNEIATIIRSERQRRELAGEETPLLFHTDASQALALLDVKVNRLGVDLLTLSAAKVYGPKQVGLLWMRPSVTVVPTIVGGGQEHGLRSGTENVAGVIGFATALEIAAKKRSGEVKRLHALRDEMLKYLQKSFPNLVVSSDVKHSLSGMLNISFPGVDAERLIFWLETKGVLVATGSACAANAGVRSHVLSAIGLTDDEINGSLRISLGRLNNQEQIKIASELIIQAVNRELGR